MARLKWDQMIDLYPRAHIVVGDLAPGSRLSPVRPVVAVVKALGPTGDYAVAMDGRVAVRAAFARKADADRLALALNARVEAKAPGWGSQRYYIMDDATVSRIDKALSDLFVD